MWEYFRFHVTCPRCSADYETVAGKHEERKEKLVRCARCGWQIKITNQPRYSIERAPRIVV